MIPEFLTLQFLQEPTILLALIVVLIIFAWKFGFKLLQTIAYIVVISCGLKYLGI